MKTKREHLSTKSAPVSVPCLELAAKNRQRISICLYSEPTKSATKSCRSCCLQKKAHKEPARLTHCVCTCRSLIVAIVFAQLGILHSVRSRAAQFEWIPKWLCLAMNYVSSERFNCNLLAVRPLVCSSRSRLAAPMFVVWFGHWNLLENQLTVWANQQRQHFSGFHLWITSSAHKKTKPPGWLSNWPLEQMMAMTMMNWKRWLLICALTTIACYAAAAAAANDSQHIRLVVGGGGAADCLSARASW